MAQIAKELLEDIENEQFSAHEQEEIQQIIKDIQDEKIPKNHDFKKKLQKRLERKYQELEEKRKQEYFDTIPSFAKRRLRLSGFIGTFLLFLVIFIFSNDFFTGKLIVQQKFTPVESQAFSNFLIKDTFASTQGVSPELVSDQIFGLATNTPMIEEASDQRKIKAMTLDMGSDTFEEVNSDVETSLSQIQESIRNTISSFSENVTYRFTYDGKYPKLAEKLPVYKITGALINKGLEEQSINMLKLWNFSFKEPWENKIKNLTLSNESKNYDLSLDFERWEASLFHWEKEDKIVFADVPSEKEIKKRIKNKVKSFGIDLWNYDDLVLLFTGDIVSFQYPLLLNKIPVYYPWIHEERVWLNGRYDIHTDTIELNNIDIAKYDVAEFSILSKEEIENKITFWGDFINSYKNTTYQAELSLQKPTFVYLFNADGYYVPALQFKINTDESPFNVEPSVLYIQLVK